MTSMARAMASIRRDAVVLLETMLTRSNAMDYRVCWVRKRSFLDETKSTVGVTLSP